MVTVFVCSNPFKQDAPQYQASRSLSLDGGTNNTLDLIPIVRYLVAHMYKPHIAYKKAGVILSELQTQDHVQLTLGENGLRPNDSVMKAVDALNERYGRSTVHVAASRAYHNKRQHPRFTSPGYTTRWSDLLRVS